MDYISALHIAKEMEEDPLAFMPNPETIQSLEDDDGNIPF